MAEKELVLDLGIEGGGACVYRTPLAAGGWEFHVEGTSMDLDENDDEVWRAFSREPVATLDEALAGFPWALFCPTTVHPDYRELIWGKVQEAARTVEGEFREHWNRNFERWKRCCDRDPDRSPEGRSRHP